MDITRNCEIYATFTIFTAFYIKTCRVRDPDFRECAIKNGNDAIPYLIKGDKENGIPSMNPLRIPYVSINALGGMSLNGTDIQIGGLPDAKVIDMGVNTDTHKLFLKLRVPVFSVKLNYVLTGKLLSLAIEGQGPAQITANGLVAEYKSDFSLEPKNGKRYLKLSNQDLNIDPEMVIFHFDNLFNGNKALGDETNKFLNDNWKDVLKEFEPALKQIATSIIIDVIKKFLVRIPADDVLPTI